MPKRSYWLAAVLRPIIDVVVSEITKATEFARTHLGNAEVGRLVITGGGAFLPGLSEFLVERTSMEVSLGDPWADFEKTGLITKLIGQGAIYSVATGLALRS